MQSFSQKAPDEVWIVGMDFTAQLAAGATITAQSVGIESAPGSIDANALAMLAGSALLAGNVVSQKIEGGIPDNIYMLYFDAIYSNGKSLEAQPPCPSRRSRADMTRS